MEIVIGAASEQEIQAAFAYYEDLKEGLGVTFLFVLDQALEGLKAHPEKAALWMPPYRRLLVPRFPYGIFYSIEGRRIFVAALLLLTQDPRKIRRRLGL